MSEIEMINLTSHIPVRALLKEFEKNGCKIPENAEQQLNQVLNILYARWSPRRDEGKKKTQLESTADMSRELRNVLRSKRPIFKSEGLRFLDSTKALMICKESWWNPTKGHTFKGATDEMLVSAVAMEKNFGYPIDNSAIKNMIPHTRKERLGNRVYFTMKAGVVSMTTQKPESERLCASVPVDVLSDHVLCGFLNKAEKTWKVCLFERHGSRTVYIHDGTAAVHFNP